jgi:chromosome segregation ATPase
MARATNAVTKKDLDDLGKTLGVAIARLDAKIDTTNSKVDATSSDIARLDAKVDATNARLDATNARLDATNGEVHRLGVLVENELATKTQAALEATTSARDEVLRAMGEMEARLDQRIATLEAVVRDHSAHLERLSSGLGHLTAEVRELRGRFDRRDDLEALERRVTEIEQRLSHV